jgi:hypothetical protein
LNNNPSDVTEGSVALLSIMLFHILNESLSSDLLLFHYLICLQVQESTSSDSGSVALLVLPDTTLNMTSSFHFWFACLTEVSSMHSAENCSSGERSTFLPLEALRIMRTM